MECAMSKCIIEGLIGGKRSLTTFIAPSPSHCSSICPDSIWFVAHMSLTCSMAPRIPESLLWCEHWDVLEHGVKCCPMMYWWWEQARIHTSVPSCKCFIKDLLLTTLSIFANRAQRMSWLVAVCCLYATIISCQRETSSSSCILLWEGVIIKDPCPGSSEL